MVDLTGLKTNGTVADGCLDISGAYVQINSTSLYKAVSFLYKPKSSYFSITITLNKGASTLRWIRLDNNGWSTSWGTAGTISGYGFFLSNIWHSFKVTVDGYISFYVAGRECFRVSMTCDEGYPYIEGTNVVMDVLKFLPDKEVIGLAENVTSQGKFGIKTFQMTDANIKDYDLAEDRAAEELSQRDSMKTEGEIIVPYNPNIRVGQRYEISGVGLSGTAYLVKEVEHDTLNEITKIKLDNKPPSIKDSEYEIRNQLMRMESGAGGAGATISELEGDYTEWTQLWKKVQSTLVAKLFIDENAGYVYFADVLGNFRIFSLYDGSLLVEGLVDHP